MAGAKEPIRLRKRKMPTGNTSLYLDIYINGRRTYEYLKMYLIPEKSKADREANRQTLQLAEAIKSKRIIELQNDVSEGLRPETVLRIRNLSGFAFDLAVEEVCRLIKRVRDENHIADQEATARKIRPQLHNLHEDRKSRFDPFTYHGKRISAYCNPDWIEQVAVIVESEIYHEQGANNGRAYTNVKMVYDDIKIDFYHRINA